MAKKSAVESEYRGTVWVGFVTEFYRSFSLDNQLLRELYAYCW